jgi:hypothetical protein
MSTSEYQAAAIKLLKEAGPAQVSDELGRTAADQGKLR